MINYGEALRYQREMANIKQPDLAAKIGSSQQNISRWERGEVIPGIDFCVKLADYYNISLDELIGREYSSDAIIIKENKKSEVEELFEKLDRQNKIMVIGYITALLQKQNNRGNF